VELFPSRVSVSCSLDCAVKLVSPASDQRSSLRFLIKLGECLWSKRKLAILVHMRVSLLWFSLLREKNT
jgi:hypothetical protein